MTIYVEYLERAGGAEKQRVDVFDLERVRVGRNPDSDLKFDPAKEPQVGRYHAEIYREGGQHFVKDLQSRNGTFVSGKRIERPTPVFDGDVIQFAAGGPKVRFSTRPPGATVARVAHFECRQRTSYRFVRRVFAPAIPQGLLRAPASLARISPTANHRRQLFATPHAR